MKIRQFIPISYYFDSVLKDKWLNEERNASKSTVYRDRSIVHSPPTNVNGGTDGITGMRFPEPILSGRK